jgi:cholesterol transport system auxiliary component
LAFALAACAPGPRPAPDIAYYDLGNVSAGPNSPATAGLRSIEVFAPSWLDSPALQYRLAYQAGQRRQSYAASRWVAPPAEMLRHALGACRLRLDLDEFAHVFEGPQASQAVVELRAQLLAPGGRLLARYALRASRPAASPDAKGGVAAFAGAVEELAAGLYAWLGSLDQAAKPGLNVLERCRGA